MKQSQKQCNEKMVQISVYLPISTKERLKNLAKKKSKNGVRVSMTSLASFFVTEGVNTPNKYTVS